MSHVYNFNPGPSTLPRVVLEQAQRELIEYGGTGISILETSHRAKEYERINAEAEERFKRLYNLDDSYRVLFLQGGASLQFAMVPMNFAQSGTANYVVTGSWSEKARDEATRVSTVHVAASTKDERYGRIPRADEIHLSESPAYVHLTTNNTIVGTQWHEVPDVGATPLVADMSSDIAARPWPLDRFSLVYAGAQKNLGPSGVTIVALRSEWLAQEPSTLPAILRYSTHVKNQSLYNTPPTFGVYMTNLVLGWIEELGGLAAMGARNEQKAQIIYDMIDRSNGFYRSAVDASSRSHMNITFRLPTEELEQQFLGDAKAAGMIGLKGHRSVGGIRASIYNAMPKEGCEALAALMTTFATNHAS